MTRKALARRIAEVLKLSWNIIKSCLQQNLTVFFYLREDNYINIFSYIGSDMHPKRLCSRSIHGPFRSSARVIADRSACEIEAKHESRIH